MKLLLNLWLLIFSITAFGQKNETGNIKGIVSTADSQQAGFISVKIKNSSIGTTTDEKGNFEIRKLKPGNHILQFSLTGYRPQEITVDIKPNETTSVNVPLQLTYAELQKVTVESHPANKYVETNPSSSLRLNVPLNEIPQNITVTTRQLLTDQGAIKMSDAIRTVSGIQKNYGELNDITLNFRGVEGSFNIFRNGLGGYWWNQQEDIAMIEKIEFIKGPAGFMVNNFPPGGFVNMVTKQPQREPVASVNIEYGSFDLFRLTTDWGGAFSKKSKFTYRFNAGLHNQKRAFQFGNAKHYFICGAIKYEPNKKNTITAEYNYMWGKTSGNNVDIPSLNGKLFSLPRNFAVADSKTDNLIVTDNYFRLLTSHQFNNNWSFNFLLGNIYGKWGQDYTLSADGDIPVMNDTLYRYAEFDNWQIFSKVAQVYLSGIFHTGQRVEHKILTAIDYSNRGVYVPSGSSDSKFGLYIPAPDYFVNLDSLRNFQIDDLDTFHSKNPSLYLEDHIKIKGKLIITLAARFSHEHIKYISEDIPEYQQNITYNHVTPRVGISWLFSDALSVYTVYDEFFGPIYAKTFYHTVLKPVTGYNTEAGLKSYLFKKKLAMNLSVYHLVANNTLEKDLLHPPDNFIQTGQIVHEGIDFDMSGNITSKLMINGNYAFAHAWISKGDSDKIGRKKIGTPDHSANLWLKYKLLNGKLKGFSFALGYQYMGHRAALSYDEQGENVYLPVYNLFDAAISYHNEKFNIGLNVYNITNMQYATMGVFKPSNNEWRYTPGEPINFRLSFGVNWFKIKRRSP
jgi:iron complex outermembrane receptor protein